MRRPAANEFSTMVDYYFKVEEVVTKEKSNEFCDGRNYLLRLLNILRGFMKQDQKSGAQNYFDRLNIFKSTLYACKDVNPVAIFRL